MDFFTSKAVVAIYIVIFGFATGRLLCRYFPAQVTRIRDFVIALALRFCIPVSIALAIWVLPNLSIQMAWLPFLGLAILLAGFLIGLLLSTIHRFSPADRAVFAPAGAYTNIGAIGSLVATLYIGELGLALLPLLKLFEEILYYGYFFPYAAKHNSTSKTPTLTPWKDPIIITMLLCVFGGILLNALSIPRPNAFNGVSNVLVPLGTYSLLVSVGLIFRFTGLQQHWKPALLLALVKQVALPALWLISFLVLLMVFPEQKLVFQVAFLVACMPMAFIVILPANLYGLDESLANACWFYSTLVFLVSVSFIGPVLQWFQ